MVNWFLLAAIIFSIFGMAWFALAMDSHWRQVCSGKPSATTVKLLRILGASALFASLLFCLGADHASMAALVWVMLLAVAAMSVSIVRR